MLRKYVPFALLAPLTLAITFGAGSAQADFVEYILDYAPTPGGASSPYVKVTVQLDEDFTGTTDRALITFDAGIYNYILTRAGGANVGANFGPTLTSVSGAAFYGGVASLAIISIVNNVQMDGLGFYSTVGASDVGGASPPQTDKIVLTALGEWSSPLTVLAANPANSTDTNNSGRLLAAHVAPKDNTGNTFYVGGADPGFPDVAVPIPAAVWLFGTGLLGLIGIARRKPRVA